MKPESLIQEIQEMIDDSADYNTGVIRDTGFSIGYALKEVVGIVIIILIIGLLIIMALEILYLCIPALHDNIGLLQEKNEIAGKTTRVLFRTAIKADEKAEESDKNVMIIYLGMKIKVIVLTVVIIWILINLGSFIKIIQRLVGPFKGLF